MKQQNKSDGIRYDADQPTESTSRYYRVSYFLIGLALLALASAAIWVFAQGQAGQSVIDTDNVANASTPLPTGIQGDATTLDLAAYAGKVVVVNFMAGWCPTCWAEVSDFVEVYRELSGEGLVIIGVSLQTPVSQTGAMISQLDIPYPVFMDKSGNVALNRFKLRAMPSTFVFDRQGKQVRRLDGAVKGRTLRSIVRDLL